MRRRSSGSGLVDELFGDALLGDDLEAKGGDSDADESDRSPSESLSELESEGEASDGNDSAYPVLSVTLTSNVEKEGGVWLDEGFRRHAAIDYSVAALCGPSAVSAFVALEEDVSSRAVKILAIMDISAGVVFDDPAITTVPANKFTDPVESVLVARSGEEHAGSVRVTFPRMLFVVKPIARLLGTELEMSYSADDCVVTWRIALRVFDRRQQECKEEGERECRVATEIRVRLGFYDESDEALFQNPSAILFP